MHRNQQLNNQPSFFYDSDVEQMLNCFHYCNWVFSKVHFFSPAVTMTRLFSVHRKQIFIIQTTFLRRQMAAGSSLTTAIVIIGDYVMFFLRRLINDNHCSTFFVSPLSLPSTYL